MLTIPLPPHDISQPSFRYSHILRCIGQKLELLDLKAVELKRQGEAYVVQGWHKGTSSSVDVEQRYTLEDVRRLEIEGKASRRARQAAPNLLSLSQVLRSAGNYVDRVDGQLLRVSWQVQSDKIQSVTVQYEPCQAERSGENSQILIIDEICFHIYKQRKRIAGSADKVLLRQSGKGTTNESTSTPEAG